MECFKENKWCPRHEPDELRGSSPVLRGPRGEVPRGYSANPSLPTKHKAR